MPAELTNVFLDKAFDRTRDVAMRVALYAQALNLPKPPEITFEDPRLFYDLHTAILATADKTADRLEIRMRFAPEHFVLGGVTFALRERR